MAELAADLQPEAPVGDALPPPEPIMDDDAQGAREKAALRTKRSTLGGEGHRPTPPAQISGDEDFEALAPGAKFIGPDGRQRVKPYTVASERDYELVPEGMQFVDPEGKTRQKPKFEPIDYTAQTLFDMSVTDKERRKALERSYPGKVKEDQSGLYVVDEDGTFRRPNRGLTSALGGATAAVAPVGGAILGAIGGGVGGSAVPGAGNVAGTMAGGMGGSLLGQGVNDIVLGLAGVYDRTTGEQAANMAIAGMSGGMGAGVGRGIATAIPTLKGGISGLSAGASGIAARFLGADPAATRIARELADKGVAVPPSAWAKEAPHLQNIVEVFDPAFHTDAPLLKSATGHYERTAGKILEDMGVKTEGSLVEPTAAVPTQRAGEAILQRTLRESAEADQRLKDALDQRRAALQSGLPETQAQREALQKAADDARKAAQGLIDQGYQEIDRTIDAAMKTAKVGSNSGELWQAVGSQLQGVKRGVMERASTMYREADELAGSNLPAVGNLPQMAARFSEQLPEEFQRNQPAVVRQLRAMAGEVNAETGEVIRPPAQPTFGQLHNLRSQIRSNADFWRLSSDIKNGAYKFFAKAVDDALHNPGAVPELKAAARALDKADAFYRENMAIFESRQINAVMKGLEAGEPADPKALFNIVVKEGHTDLTNRIREMVGPNLWAGVRAADLQQMMEASRSLIPGQIDGRAFSREVLERYRSGILQSVHGKDVTESLLRQAQAIEMLEGRLPLTVRPDDTLSSVIQRARATAQEAKEAAKNDPLLTLKKETEKIQREAARGESASRSARRKEPLGFLHDPTTGATEAVDKILGNEDLILAAAARFGEKSPEFDMLRQIYAQRILQGTMQPSKKLEKIAPEIQNIMFPGTTLSQMQTLAKEMDFLMAGDLSRGTAQGMSAMAKVEHPWSNIAGRGGAVSKLLTAPTKIIPGADPGGRALLGWYYGTIRKIMTSPALLRWVEKGLNGSSEQRDVVRQYLRTRMNAGGAIGAGAGEAEFQESGP